MCNSEIKFKIFLDEALSHGFDKVATGHYAQIIEENSIFHLKKWVDKNKDQSYFLAWLSQFQLSKSLFPIGHLQKSEVRKIALDAGLPNATRKRESGDLFCRKSGFITIFRKKIEHKIGNILDTSGKILGQHKWVFLLYHRSEKMTGYWRIKRASICR